MAQRAALCGVCCVLSFAGIAAATSVNALIPAVQVTSGARSVTTPQATVELIARAPATLQGVSEVWVGLRFRLLEKWHIYWRNPGDSGGPPTITWHLPEGVTAGDIIWPMPARLPLGPLMNYGYEGDVVLPVLLTVGAGARSAATLPVRADVGWLVCSDVCFSQRGSLTMTLPTTGAEQVESADWARRIEIARSAEPRPAPPTWRAQVASEKEYFVLTIETDGPAESAYFFPLVESQIDDSTKQEVATEGRTIRLRLRKSSQLAKDPASLKGVLALASGRGFEINAPVHNELQRGRQ